jgi:hypothetical protein
LFLAMVSAKTNPVGVVAIKKQRPEYLLLLEVKLKQLQRQAMLVNWHHARSEL